MPGEFKNFRFTEIKQLGIITAHAPPGKIFRQKYEDSEFYFKSSIWSIKMSSLQQAKDKFLLAILAGDIIVTEGREDAW